MSQPPGPWMTSSDQASLIEFSDRSAFSRTGSRSRSIRCSRFSVAIELSFCLKNIVQSDVLRRLGRRVPEELVNTLRGTDQRAVIFPRQRHAFDEFRRGAFKQRPASSTMMATR